MVTTTELETRLADSGHRITQPRRALIDQMRELGDHFTAEELLRATPGVGRATVFRTLRLLQDLGVVCHVVRESGTVAYRLTSGEHHHHIVCRGCGTMNDFATCPVEDLLDELRRHTGYEIQAHRLEVYGVCAECSMPLNSPA